MADAGKVCKACGCEKPATEFTRKKPAKDGLQTCCKPCRAAEQRAYRLAHPEQVSETLRRYREKRSPGGNWLAKKTPEERRAIHRERSRKRRALYPLQASAWRKVETAVKWGKLKRPAACEACGKAGAVEAHHDDYTKPLDVKWLCDPCHGKADVQRRKTARQGE